MAYRYAVLDPSGVVLNIIVVDEGDDLPEGVALTEDEFCDIGAVKTAEGIWEIDA